MSLTIKPAKLELLDDLGKFSGFKHFRVSTEVLSFTCRRFSARVGSVQKECEEPDEDHKRGGVEEGQGSIFQLAKVR